jgi:hypothetical protein
MHRGGIVLWGSGGGASASRCSIGGVRVSTAAYWQRLGMDHGLVRTTDWYAPKHEADAPKACCIPESPRGGTEAASYDQCQPRGDRPDDRGG